MAKGFSTMWRATWIGSSRDLPVNGILPVRGVDLVGTIPSDLQFIQVFAAAVKKGTENPGVSKRLIEFLASGKVTSPVKRWGMKWPAPW